MSEGKIIQYEKIYHSLSSKLGRIRLAEKGLGWKSNSDGKMVSISGNDISNVSWKRMCRGYEIAFLLKDGTAFRFNNFKKEVYSYNFLIWLQDFDELKKAIKDFYRLNVDVKELSLKGWNFGKVELDGNTS